MINTLIILAQVSVDGFNEAAKVSPLMGVLVTIVLVLAGVSIFLFRQYQNKVKQVDKLQDELAKKVEEIQKDHNAELIEIIKEVQNNEDDLNTKWLLSEKEMLMVLNGVNGVLKLSDKSSERDNSNILEKLSEIKLLLDKIKEKIE